jgi:hypothetical protein
LGRIGGPGKLCVNKSDGTPVCVTGDQLAAVLAATNQSGTGASGTGSSIPPPSSNSAAASSSADSSATPPVLQVNGDNPATIQVGATYTDLGATVTGPTADLNLGITTYVDGTEMNPIQLDTTQAATDTIAYVATDQSGRTATSTRTVVVAAPDSAESPTGSTSTVLIEAPSIVPTDDASSTATSSAQ